MKLASIRCLMILAGFGAAACQHGSPSVATDGSRADARESPRALGAIERLDPRFDQLVPDGARLEVVAEGFQWLEGPAWHPREGFLLFSDIPANEIYRWDPRDGAQSFLTPSGYTGAMPFEGREPGSNGLVFDPLDRLVVCQHGDRRIVRVTSEDGFEVIVDRYQGKRLNSPNDAVYRSNGDLYFTDPPFGLPRTFDDSAKELPFSGVFRVTPEGAVTLLTSELKAPNGIAFSPDEETLYVTDVDPERPAWMAFDVRPDGTLSKGRVFFDAGRWRARQGGPDGLKVDVHGHLFGAGPEGVYVFAADGTHLGTLWTGVPTSNVGWGEDGSVLYVTANTRLLRIQLTTRAAHFRSARAEGGG